MEIRTQKVDLSKLLINKEEISYIERGLLPLIKKFGKIDNTPPTPIRNRWGWVNLKEFAALISNSRSIAEQEHRGELKPEDIVTTFHALADMHNQRGFSINTASLNYDSFTFVVTNGKVKTLLSYHSSCFFSGSRADFGDYFVPAGWAKSVYYLWACGVRGIFKVPHNHPYEDGGHKCGIIGSIRCDELPEDHMYIGIVPVDSWGWPILLQRT